MGYMNSPETNVKKRNHQTDSDDDNPNETKKDLDKEEDIEERGHWGSRIEFLLACLGYSVGLGNLWRFPYLAFENGGAAFLIPYLIILFAVGRPLYLMEVTLGQFSQIGVVHTWKNVAPLMGGLGYSNALSIIISCTTYMVIISYSLHYMYNCLAYIGYTLPWMTCNDEWSDDNCYVVGEQVPCSQYNLTAPTPEFNCTTANETAGDQYWRNKVLGLDGEGMVVFGEMGPVQSGLVLSLFVGWVVVCLSVIKGIQSSGKVVYFTATFPYVLMLVLMIAGLQLKGASKGLMFLFVPEWEKMLDLNVWRLACEQVLYSLSVGGGGLITFASYNQFTQKVHVDVMILAVLDLLASLMCSVTIFSVLGAMADDLGYDDITKVIASGPGLAFIAYPEAIARTLPLPHLWSFFFFFMVFTLGLDSMFGGMEVLVTTVFDSFPKTRRFKPVITTSISVALFCAGIAFCTAKGQYLFFLLDVFLSGVGTLLSALLACIALHWVYGVRKFSNDIKFMLGYRPSWFMQGTWAGLAPITLMVVFIGSLVRWKLPVYAGVTAYPAWTLWMGGLFIWITRAPVIGFFVFHVVKKVRSGDFRNLLQPTPEWGPGCPKARARLAEEERQRREEEALADSHGKDNAAFDSTQF